MRDENNIIAIKKMNHPTLRGVTNNPGVEDYGGILL